MVVPLVRILLCLSGGELWYGGCGLFKGWWLILLVMTFVFVLLKN